MALNKEDLGYREDLAQVVLNYGENVAELSPELAVPEPMIAFATTFAAVQAAAEARPALPLTFPKGLRPTPQPIDPRPDQSAPLPNADVLVVTWTVDEAHALSDVLTPGHPASRVRSNAHPSGQGWFAYGHRFESYERKINPRAPARQSSHRLGSYMPTQVGQNKVLCFKSELHLARDAMKTGDGRATLPVKDLWNQLIDEVRPKLVISAGTAGATFLDHELGDVVVSRAAKFRLKTKFAKESFNGKKFACKIEVPTDQFEAAVTQMRKFKKFLVEPMFGAPTRRYSAPRKLITPPLNTPDIKLDGRAFKEFLPILTTDYFEFGTSTNALDKLGCAVEMGDAVLGLVVHERKDSGKHAPDWLIVRNASDPQINGDLPCQRRRLERGLDMQTQWAVWYYLTFGYWTSVNSSLVVWAIAAAYE